MRNIEMVKLERSWNNRVITIRTDSTDELDKWTSELLNIIDSYGGTNPYPRLVAEGQGYLVYSCTTKIPNENIASFDIE